MSGIIEVICPQGHVYEVTRDQVWRGIWRLQCSRCHIPQGRQPDQPPPESRNTRQLLADTRAPPLSNEPDDVA